ncbi:MAG: substrate-binding domain-containing protein [Acidobacteriaceae bacterium]
MLPLEHLHTFDQLKVLSDPRRLSILKQLMVGPATLSQLGRAIGEHPAWIRHHLKQLETAGLVELSEIKVSDGYLEKYYRAKAHAFLFQQLVLPSQVGKRMVVLSGSHDLALEKLAMSLIGDLELCLLPVGSLDGLVALRQGICNATGCHLYDAQSGEFNAPFVRHFFPDHKMVLLTLAHREQGLIVPAGNPHHVHGLEDLALPIRFVNRNRGSGTRLWLDDQLTRLGIRPEHILGYDDEVCTHTEVARAIQQGRAQVGLGIHAVAAATSLDFIPLFQERFDVVMPEEQITDRQLSPLFERLYSGDFRRQVETLRGYDVTHLGDQLIL